MTEESDGTLTVDDNPLEPRFAESADCANLMKVSNGNFDLAFALMGGEPLSTGEVTTSVGGASLSEITYEDAIVSGDDLLYEIQPGSVKETIRLNSLPSQAHAQWTWVVRAPLLELTTNEYGDLRFVAADGLAKFVIPAPTMWDSSGRSEIREPAEHPVQTSIVEIGAGSWEITLSADYDWLSDPAREYPVFVDPTTSMGDSTVTSYKSDGATRTDAVHVGNSRDSNTDKYWRARVNYNYSSVYGKQVVDASLSASYVAGTTSLRTGSVNTQVGAGYNSVGISLSYLTVDTAGETAASNVNLPDKLSDWVNAKVPHFLILRGAETAGAYTYKQLNTTLKIAWRAFPKVTGTLEPSPPEGSQSSIAPSLSVAIDGAGTGAALRYLVFPSSALTGNPTHETAWSAPGPIEIAPGVLEANHTYFWVAEVKDSYDQLYGTNGVRRSSTYSFTTDGDPAGEVGTPTAEPRFEESPGQIVTVLNPLIGSYVTGENLVPTVLEAEVWTAPTGGMLVGECEYAFTEADSFESCVPDATLQVDTEYFARTRASSTYNFGDWSEWASFRTMSSSALPSGVVDSALITGDPIVEGTLLNSAGAPAPTGTIVKMILEPTSEDLEDAALGDTFVTPVVAVATTSATGHYELRVEDESQLASFVSEDDESLNVSLSAQFSGSIASYNGTVYLEPESVDAAGQYPDAYFTNEPTGTGDAPAPRQFVIRAAAAAPPAALSVLDNIADQVILSGSSSDEGIEAISMDGWPVGMEPDSVEPMPSLPVETEPVPLLGSEPKPAARLAQQSDLCTTQVVKKYKAQTIVGAIWKKSSKNSAKFEYTSAASSTLGVAVSVTGKTGSFTPAGTSSTESGGGVTWITTNPGRGSYGFATNANYEKTKTVCYAAARGPYKANPTSISGGKAYLDPGTTPNATHCDDYAAGAGDVYTSVAKGSTLNGGVKIGNSIGINLSAKTDYRTSSKLSIIDIGQRVRICGTQGGLLEGKVGLVVTKDY